MSDGRRRRYRRNRDEKRHQRREDELEMQPKILLKTKIDKEQKENIETPSTSSMAIAGSSTATAETSVSPNTTKEQTTSIQIMEPVPQMSRPSTVISSMGVVNTSAKKLLIKSNPDFLVIGVVGTQGVGKSTIMNLLANEDPNFDYYQKLFVEENCIFPTKLKANKCLSRSRTESTHMFITSDRLILLDSPPVLSNCYGKDLVTHELDDLRNIISFLSVCHLVIIVQDDYFNMSLMRLLQFAEIMKPSQHTKPFAEDYFPSLLFVKNRAKRIDFMPGQKERYDNMLRTFFNHAPLNSEQQTQGQQRQRRQRVSLSSERMLNSFFLPEFTSEAATSYHKSLLEIVKDFRTLVFMSPRNELYVGPTPLTEFIWFDLLTSVAQNTQHFFYNTYADVHHRKHLEMSGGGGSGSSNSNTCNDINKDSQEFR